MLERGLPVRRRSTPRPLRLSPRIRPQVYAFARVISPLCAARDRVFTLFAGVLAIEGLAYALTPLVVGLPHARATYTLFRVIGQNCDTLALSRTIA